MSGEQPLESLIWRNRTLVDNCNALKKLIVAYENSLAPEDLQHLLKLGNHEGRVDAARDATKVSLRARSQDLLQSIADVQNQKKQLEKLNGLNETVMGKLTEENDALQEKVKQLENDVQNLSPVSDRIAYFFIKKTDVLAEKKEYQEELNSLLKERMDMEDMEEDLHGQLTRMKDFSNYINLIKELEQQVDDLRDSAKTIKHRKKKKQCWLLKTIWNFFLSESEIIKGNVDFLIREKQEVEKKAENMEKELKVVENIISVYNNIQETHQRELDDLREKMRNCDETLESPSLWGRFRSLFCVSNLKGLKEMRKTQKQCKILSKQLEAVQQILCAQGISAEKLKTKISGLHARARMLDRNLLEFNSLTLKSKKISRLGC